MKKSAKAFDEVLIFLTNFINSFTEDTFRAYVATTI